MTDKCKRGLDVTDGKNGTVYGPAPWEPADTPDTALCYGCENAAEQAAENARVNASITAALRAGRGDCV